MTRERWTAFVTALVGAAVLVGLFSFQNSPHAYTEYIVTNVAALFWLPVLSILLILRQEPSAFGFGLGDLRWGMRRAGLLFAVVLPFLVYASRLPQFQAYYPIQKWAQFTLRDFAYYELTYGMYLFCWEFFFRGFLLFGLSRSLGVASVFVQAVAFGIMHLGKPQPEVLASFGTGVVLGLVALRSKSFVPVFVVHWAAALTFDVLIILAKRGAF